MLIDFYDKICSYFHPIDPIDRITILPNEVLIEIFKKFDLSSLCISALVSRRFKVMQDLPVMWKIQAEYFKIELEDESFKSYKTQVRFVKLTYGKLDLFTKKIEFYKDLNDQETEFFCKEVAAFMPSKHSVSMHSVSGDKKYTSRVDINRKIFSKTEVQDDYGIRNPLERRSFF